LYWLEFDFNPIHLRDPRTESIATYLDLARDPTTNPNTLQVLAPSLDEAGKIAERVAKVPEVARAMTLVSFIPDRQEGKLPLIGEAAKPFADAFDPANVMPPPTDAENVDALKEGAQRLTAAAADQTGPGAAAAKRLAAALTKIAEGKKDLRDATEIAFL